MGILDTIKSRLFWTQTVEQQAQKYSDDSGASQAAALMAATAGIPVLNPWRNCAGKIRTYRMMRRHPTIALARMLVMAPIIASQWGYEINKKKGAGVEDKRLEFIQDQLNAIRTHFMRYALTGLDYGFAAMELRYELTSDGLIGMRLPKPLLADMTEILVDKTGEYVGLKQGEIELPKEKCFRWTNHGEAGDWYGESRHEGIRNDWNGWMRTALQMDRYLSKVANIIPRIHYPEGTSKDASGADRPNFWLACQLARDIVDGKPVVFPNMFHAGERASDMAELAGKSQWMVDFLEVPGNDMTSGFIAGLKYKDANMFRGWLRPERSGLEATTAGSRADSETHSDSAVLDCELIEDDIVGDVQEQIADNLLELNWGSGARGTVLVKAAPIADNKMALNEKVLAGLLASPEGLKTFLENVDVAASFKQLDMPVREGAEFQITPDSDALPADIAQRISGLYETGGQSQAVQSFPNTVQGGAEIQALQTAYYSNEIPREACIANATIIFGFKPEEAEKLFPEIKLPPSDPAVPPVDPAVPAPPFDKKTQQLSRALDSDRSDRFSDADAEDGDIEIVDAPPDDLEEIPELDDVPDDEDDEDDKQLLLFNPNHDDNGRFAPDMGGGSGGMATLEAEPEAKPKKPKMRAGTTYGGRPLTASEKREVEDWKESSGFIRAGQRNGNWDDPSLKAWESAMEKCPRFKGTSYRGLKIYDANTIAKWKGLQKGSVIVFNVDSSSSKDKNIGFHFANLVSPGSTGMSVVMKVKGFTGRDIHELGGSYKDEKEVVIRRNTYFSVTAVEEQNLKGKPFLKVSMKELRRTSGAQEASAKGL